MNKDKRLKLWICLALAAVTLAVYSQALRFQFLTFDDQAYVTENRHVLSGLTLSNINWAFHNVVAGNWHPLTMMSHMLDSQIYGLKPWGHHLTSILFHTANTVLLFLLLARMTGGTWPSACVAALFALHPTHVESVAWIAERKDVLCGFFCFLAIWGYLKAQPSTSKYRYLSVTLLFLAALMSKPMAVTLPFILLLIDLWPLNRVKGLDWPAWRRLVLEKWPLLLLSLVWCGVTMWAQGKDKAVASAEELPLLGRVGHAMISYCVYVRLVVFPWHLSAYYPYQRHESLLLIALATATLAIATVIAIACARRRPYITVGWLWFLGMLVPVVGFVQVGGQAWADRYLYLPAIGFFVIIVWGAIEWVSRFPAVKLLFPFVCVILAAATSFELPYWHDTGTLFARAIEVTKDNYLAMTLKGSMDADAGKLDDAIALFQRALTCKPAYPEAHFFLGRAFDSQGLTNKALAQFEEALRLRPDFDAAHVMVGLILYNDGKYDQAVEHYRAAIQANPDSSVAQSDWGMALTKKGRWKESIPHYEESLRIDPNQAEAHNNLAIDYLQTGRLANGIRELRLALMLNPESSDTKLLLGQALNQSEQWSEAATLLEPLSKTRASDSSAQFQCGLSEEHLGRTADAMGHYSAALQINPDFPEALQHLAWISATEARPELRDGARAVRLAQHASQLTGNKRAGILLTLAAAYAEAGQFNEALTAIGKASDIAKAQGQHALEEQAARLQKTFEARQAFHGQSK